MQDYVPSKLHVGAPHPDPVVETASLAAVEPPDITYQLHLDDLIRGKVLSGLQLESIVYACQRHEQLLPDNSRAGMFIGDGAGVGKGRTIAGACWGHLLCCCFCWVCLLSWLFCWCCGRHMLCVFCAVNCFAAVLRWALAFCTDASSSSSSQLCSSQLCALCCAVL